MLWTKTFLLLVFTIPTLQTLQNCATGLSCPPEGIWSEWSSTERCATNCGSCSKMFYTRKCLSDRFNCPCTGDSSRATLCNTQACQYPAQRTCCIPRVPMLVNGSMQCGPIPAISQKPVTSCCPIGGVWSKWSAWGRNDANTRWISTRECLSESVGCPCENPQLTLNTSTTCPCRPMLDVEYEVTYGTSNSVYPLNYSIDHNLCEYTGYLERYIGRPCNRYIFDGYKDYDFVSVIRYVRTQKIPGDARYADFRVYACDGTNPTAVVTFYCNLQDRYWRLMWNDVAVNGWAQINI